MIGIIAAHPIEVRDTIRELRGRRVRRRIMYGTLRGIDVALCVSGQGWRHTTRACERLCELSGCRGVVIAGFCGATVPGAQSGDLVISDEVLDLHLDGTDGPRYHTSIGPRVRQVLGGFGGTLGTVGRVVASPSAKRRLGESRRLIAVDLESAAAAAVASRRGIPWIVARVILDPMEQPLAITSAWQALRLAVRPRQWSLGRRFFHDLNRAQHHLAAHLARGVAAIHHETLNREDQHEERTACATG